MSSHPFHTASFLTTTSALHYEKIVQNEHWVRLSSPRGALSIQTDMCVQGYPEEWFPSVSATIGDRYPERSVFQVFIAITSGNHDSVEERVYF